MLSEKGSLKDTPVMKLLLTIFEQGLTGILYVKHTDILKVLYFSRGKLIWAISNWEEDKLENILLSKSLVDPVTLQKVKKESHVSESIGKLLVEKGLITLEELIDASREQLRRIIIDVLKWTDGGFQFIKDAPPERLLSLDLAITDFIIDYIVEEMDISVIWKAIGSLQVELIKNPDEEKLSRYQLSDRQVELLNSFDGEKKLEGILSRYSGGHRESLLKIIYFFLMAELLIKKEFELNDDLSAFESDHGFDSLESGAVEKSVGDEETPVKATDSYVFAGEGKDGGGSENIELTPAPPSIYQIPGREQEAPRKAGERKRMKLFNVILILIFLILVFGGVILLLLPWLESDTPLEEMVKKKETGDVIKIEETGPGPGNSTAAGSKGETGTPATGDKGDESKGDESKGEGKEPKDEAKEVEKPLKPAEDDKKTAETKTTPAPVQDKKEKEKKQTEDKKTEPPTGKPAMSYFREGSLITAGDVWKKELKKAGVKYSILLELDCMKESVMSAYGRIEAKKDFFIISRMSGRRTCFMVMWGKFFTKQGAADALELIPNYFWKQKNPPEIVELSNYL